MKKIISIFIVLFSLVTLIGCTNENDADIITTLYPQYDIAKTISGDKLSVRLLTPFGSEVHAYEPSSKDILRIRSSKLFLYTSNEMDPWVKNILTKETNALDLSSAYNLVPYEHSDIVDDLHYWTDPLTIMQLVTTIKERIIEVDPDHASYYEDNALKYINDLNEVHQTLASYLSDKNHPTIFFYGHNAMSSFGSRYAIEIASLSSNYKPDIDLSPGQIKALKEKIKNAKATYLFVEELIDLKSPKAFQDELLQEGYPLEILELHGFHNISKSQDQKGVSYIDLLRQNYENLKRALD